MLAREHEFSIQNYGIFCLKPDGFPKKRRLVICNICLYWAVITIFAAMSPNSEID